jgi:hypothetical protein
MDFLQEDVDSMQRELESWRTENKQLQAQLKYDIFMVLKSSKKFQKNYILNPKIQKIYQKNTYNFKKKITKKIYKKKKIGLNWNYT